MEPSHQSPLNVQSGVVTVLLSTQCPRVTLLFLQIRFLPECVVPSEVLPYLVLGGV